MTRDMICNTHIAIVLISSPISITVGNNGSKLLSRSNARIKTWCVAQKAPLVGEFFPKVEGVLRFCYAIVQFRWFMIPSLYRLYDRSSNGEQKDLLHAVTISRRKAMENTVARHNFHEGIWIYSTKIFNFTKTHKIN